MKTEHILIIRFSAIGDVAMLTPVVSSLAQQYPQIRITVLSQPFAQPFFEGLAPNVGFMAADIKKEYHGIHGLNKLFKRLAAKHFTAVADMHGVLRTHYLRMLFNAAKYHTAHIDKHRKGKQQLAAQENKVFIQQPTSFENYADVLAELGYPVKLDFTSLFNEHNPAVDIFSTIGEKKADEKWIGIAPFAAHEGKIYPIQKMEKVIEMLEQQYPSCRIFLFGGNKEKEQFETWCQLYKKCTRVAAVLKGLKEELSLIHQLDVMISMDSANMHLASLVNTPVVSIWGATHPYAGFMGWNQRIDNAVQIDLPCRPCSIYGKKPCYRNDFACMNQITPETIVEKVNHIINH